VNTSIDRARLFGHLEKLLLAHAPPGSEAEMDQLVMDMVQAMDAPVWQDAAGSIVIHIKGHSDASPIAVTAHKDEISMIVKRVEEDGRLRVRSLGGLWPWAIGEGPVEILGREGLVAGVLSTGSKHASAESSVFDLKEKAPMTWEVVWIETKLSVEELRQRGVRVGSKAVLARSRKHSSTMGDFICAYNLDCRAGLAALIETALQLQENPPPQDVYLVASSEEEIGAFGATYSLAQLPVETAIALDIVPVAAEYQTRNCGAPILGCKDNISTYDERIVYHMEDLANAMDFGSQTVVVTSYGSDATIAKKAGSVARAALIGYPGDNTHGYEICSTDGIANTARLLLAYLHDPVH
jgi:putative aminopeptidase FrvX